MSSGVTLNFNGSEYLYYVYYDGGKGHEKYCGLVEKYKPKRKATNFEIADLQSQKEKISRRITDLHSEIKQS